MYTDSRVGHWLAVLVILLGLQTAVQAAKVLYVQDIGQRDSAKLVDILVAAGHDVTVLNTGGGDVVDTAANYAAAGYELLIVDESINSSAVGSQFINSPIPVVSSEAYLLRSTRASFTTQSGGGSNYPDVTTAGTAPFGQIMGETQINITDAGHPLAAGLGAGLQTLWDTSIDTNKFPIVPEDNVRNQGVATFANGANNLVSGVTKVAEVPGGSDFWCIFVVEPGVVLNDGTSTNQARWVELPWNITYDGRVLKEPAFFLFEAGVAYALGLPDPPKIRNLTDPAVFASTNTTISFSVDKSTADGTAVQTANIGMTINGVDVSGDLVAADGGSTWDVAYTNGFAVDQVYTIVVTAVADDGGKSGRITRIDTLDSSHFTVEAEDYNYLDGTNAGQYFQSPSLCTEIGGTGTNCYFDRVSSNTVDRVKGNTRVTVTDAQIYNVEVYRFGSGALREESMDTYVSADWAVEARPERVMSGIADYEVRNIGANDWQNYTRTYPTGTFNIYLRMLSSSSNGTVQLDIVDDAVAPTTTNTLGTFTASGIGPQTVPLGAGGVQNPVELTATGPSTLRLTQLGSGWNMEGYFVLVPTVAPVNEAPTVSLDSPSNRTNLTEGDSVTIRASATDDVGVVNVAFKINGVVVLTDTTAPYSYDWTVPSPGAIRSDYVLEVVATDTGGLPSVPASVKVFAADPTITRVTSQADAWVQELASGSPTDTGSGTGNVQARSRYTDPFDINEVSAIRFDLTGFDLTSLQDLHLNMVNQRNNQTDAIIHFYGVVDGSTGGDNNGKTPGWNDNTWDEGDTNGNLAFSTMPGLIYNGTINDFADQGINASDTVDLGVVTNFTPTAVDSLFSYSSSNLTAFLAGNPDSLVTILIAADNSSSGQKRWCSKETTSLSDGGGTVVAGTVAPFLSFRAPAVTITIDTFSRAGDQLTLTWSGGTGPYSIQKASPLNGGWNVETNGISGNSATLTISGNEGYYRVVGQ